jgi:hypothetical protein
MSSTFASLRSTSAIVRSWPTAAREDAAWPSPDGYPAGVSEVAIAPEAVRNSSALPWIEKLAALASAAR